MLHVYAFNAHPMLRHCVDSYQIVSVFHPEGGYIENTRLPQVNQSLVFALVESSRIYEKTQAAFTTPHFITGPNDEICHCRLYSGLKNMVIQFKPAGFYKIFRFPAMDFTNKSRDAVEFLGKEIHDVRRQILETPLSRKIEFLDNWLIKNLLAQKKTNGRIDEAIQLIERFKGNITLTELEKATYTTKRTLERHFLEQVGLNPKTFSRLIRFQGVIRFMEANMNFKWSQLVELFGYYDQSHFIREFKSLAGSLPHDYFSIKPGIGKFLQA